MKIKLSTLRKLIREEVGNVLTGPNESNTIQISYGQNGPVIIFGDNIVHVWDKVELDPDDDREFQIEAIIKEIEIIETFQPQAKFVNDPENERHLQTISKYIQYLKEILDEF